MSDQTEDEDNRKRRMSSTQLKVFTKFMLDNPQLVLGKISASKTPVLYRRLWKQCAEHLNMLPGPKRSCGEWAKSWADRRSVLKKKLIAKKRSNRRVLFTELEEKLASIIESNALNPTEYNYWDTGANDDSPLDEEKVVEDIPPGAYRPSISQLKYLVQFLLKHQDMVKEEGAVPENERRNLWKQLADELNALPGPYKENYTAWSNVWNECKSKLKRKMSHWRLCKENNTQPNTKIKFGELERKMLVILGMEVPGDENTERADSPIKKIKGEPVEDIVVEPFDENEDDGNNMAECWITVEKAETANEANQNQYVEEEAMDDFTYDEPDRPSTSRHSNHTDTLSGNKDREQPDRATAAEFLRVETKKLDSMERLTDAVKEVKSEVSRLADVLTDIKDILVAKLSR